MTALSSPTGDLAPAPQPYKVPRAPEWVYRRLAGLPVEVSEATVTDEDLDIEARIERSPRHSIDSFEGWGVGLMEAHDFYLTGMRREIVHRAGCPKLAEARRPPAGWPFGDDKTPKQLRDELAERGATREDTRFCRVCCPEVEPLPRWQEPVCVWKGCGLPYSDPIHVRDHGFVHPDDMRGR